MKFIQDLNDNLYNLNHITGFEHEYDEDHNIFDLMAVMGNQRFLLVTEIQLFSSMPDFVICTVVEYIIESKETVISNKQLTSMICDFTGRFNR